MLKLDIKTSLVLIQFNYKWVAAIKDLIGIYGPIGPTTWAGLLL